MASSCDWDDLSVTESELRILRKSSLICHYLFSECVSCSVPTLERTQPEHWHSLFHDLAQLWDPQERPRRTDEVLEAILLLERNAVSPGDVIIPTETNPERVDLLGFESDSGEDSYTPEQYKADRVAFIIENAGKPCHVWDILRRYSETPSTHLNL